MIEVRVARDLRGCNACDATNYKPSFPCRVRVVEKMYELRIDHTVLCLCEDCLKKVRSSVNTMLEGDE